jgi:putative membrane protein
MQNTITSKLALLTLATTVTLLSACSRDETTTTTALTETASDTSTTATTDTSMTTASSTDTTMTSTAATTGAANMSAQDHEFTTKAAAGGLAEVQLGQLAQQKAQSADVKSFAAKMVQDHSQANTELTQIASTKGMTAPAELDQKHKDVMTKLNGLTGAEFDKEYMKAMMADHQEAVSLFQKQSNEGTDAELKAFASKTLPTLQQHHELATSTAKKAGAQ